MIIIKYIRIFITVFFTTIAANSAAQNYCENSFLLDGSKNSYVSIIPKNGYFSKDLYSLNGFTWECWFNLGNRTVISKPEIILSAMDSSKCEDIGIVFNWPDSGKLNFIVSGNTGCNSPRINTSFSTVWQANTWYHIAGVCDYSNKLLHIYFNGLLQNSVPIDLPILDRMQKYIPVTIGNKVLNDNPNDNAHAFSGSIDEVRLWNIVRPQDSLAFNLKKCVTSKSAGLVAYFKGDEGNNSNTISEVDDHYTGALQNAANWGAQVKEIACKKCVDTLCHDSLIINTADTGWQALQLNNTWGNLDADVYAKYIFDSYANVFPLLNRNNCIWGPITFTYNKIMRASTSGTATVSKKSHFAKMRKSFLLPNNATLNKVEFKYLSDDFIDTILVNDTVVYAIGIVHYGQYPIYGSHGNSGTSQPINYVTLKSGDAGGNYGTYFQCKIHYSYPCKIEVICKDKKQIIEKCDNEDLTLFADEGANYLWQPTANLSNPYIGNPILTGIVNTSYLVSFTDKAGCTRVDTFIVKTNAAPNAAFQMAPIKSKYPLFENIELIPFVTIHTHEWWVNGGKISSNNYVPTEPYALTALHKITDTSTGCADTASIIIYMEDCFENMYIPNIFTPASDNLNDIFLCSASCMKSFTLKIYNRWGEKIFESNSLKIGWDGKSQNSPCADGVYVYTVESVGYSNRKYKFSGTINLVR